MSVFKKGGQLTCAQASASTFLVLRISWLCNTAVAMHLVCVLSLTQDPNVFAPSFACLLRQVCIPVLSCRVIIACVRHLFGAFPSALPAVATPWSSLPTLLSQAHSHLCIHTVRMLVLFDMLCSCALRCLLLYLFVRKPLAFG